MPLLVYVDPISESSRAIVIFCRLFQLPVDVRSISIKRGEHRTPELTRANPLGKVPFLLDDRVCVPEACAILTYLAQSFQLQVPESWYPTELRAKTQVDAGLHWQQRTLRYHTDKLLSERVVRANRATPAGAPAAAGSSPDVGEALRGVQEALSQLEFVWLANGQGVQQKQRREEPPPAQPLQQQPAAAAAMQQAEDLNRGAAGAEAARAVVDGADDRPGLKPNVASSSLVQPRPPTSPGAEAEAPRGEPPLDVKKPVEQRMDGAAGDDAACAAADTLQAIDQAVDAAVCVNVKTVSNALEADVPGSVGAADLLVKEALEARDGPALAAASEGIQDASARPPRQQPAAQLVAVGRRDSTPGAPQLGGSTASALPRAVAAGEPSGSPPAFTFMGGGNSPCISDLVCACIVEQLRLLDSVQEKPDWADIILQFPRVRAWLISVEAECRPHFKEVHANLRQSVARAHMAVVQQREAVATSGATALAPPVAAAAAGAAAPGSLAAGRAAGMSRVASFSHAAAAVLAAGPSQRPPPGPGGMDGVAGVPLPPSLGSPRNIGVPATSSGGGAMVPAPVVSSRPPGLPGPPPQAAASSGVGAVGGGAAAVKPSFTPSFPALPTAPHSASSTAETLRAIFNGQPPAVAAAATAKPAASGLWQVPPRGVTAPAGQVALTRSGSSSIMGAQLQQQQQQQQRGAAAPAAKGFPGPA